jgi:hypothetical protein
VANETLNIDLLRGESSDNLAIDWIHQGNFHVTLCPCELSFYFLSLIVIYTGYSAGEKGVIDMNTQFLTWFKGSVAVDEYGKPQPFYHGSIQDFKVFDIAKIRADETDAVYNGFWFTSEKDGASPAWRNPKFVKTCYLRLCNPAPHEVSRMVNKEVMANPSRYQHADFRSYADAVRFELLKLGYDGVIHNDKPVINTEELRLTGKTSYRTVRGSLYSIAFDKEWGGLDLFDYRGDQITGYEDYKDFITQHSERTFVVFDPMQVFIAHTDKVN